MRKSRAAPVRRPTIAKPRGTLESRPDVTPNEITDSLVRIFDRLSVELAQLRRRAAGLPPHALNPHATAIGEILTAWHQNPDYLDGAGNPAPLKLKGAGASLKGLAHSMLLKMDEALLLAELKKLGAVSTDEHELIHIRTRAFPAHADKRLAIQHTLTALDGFIRTLRHNLLSHPGSNTLFHRIAWNEDFDARELPALNVRLRRHGQAFLERLDDWLACKSVPRADRLGDRRGGLGAVGKRRRPRTSSVSVGVYLTVLDK